MASSTVLFNGVSTIDEPRFLIYIKTDSGFKTLGVSTSKKEAIEVIRNIGRSELKNIMTVFDEKWTKFTVEFDEENGPCYAISVEKLGRFMNSTPFVHTRVYFEETKYLYPSEYVEEKPAEQPVDGLKPDGEKPAEQPIDGLKPVEQTLETPTEPLIQQDSLSRKEDEEGNK